LILEWWIDKMKYYVGVDLGGTNIVAAVLDQSFRILAQASVSTPISEGPESVCEAISGLILNLLDTLSISNTNISRIGVGTPGLLVDNVIRYANNLGFIDVPLAEMLEWRLNKKVFLCGDASAAAYGEYMLGAGKGRCSIVMLTIGTGIGGGIITRGRLHTGVLGLSPEPGHIETEPGGRLCACGKRGCLEAYCSASALRDLTVEKMLEDSDSTMWKLCNGDINLVSARTAFDAAQMGDLAASDLVGAYVRRLAKGINTIVNLLFPELIVIGGGVANEGDNLLSPLRCELDRIKLFDTSRLTPEIVCASLGNTAGVIGAALMATSGNTA
jgi:glucokinase